VAHWAAAFLNALTEIPEPTGPSRIPQLTGPSR
jgi:hypothetical protein